MFPRYCLKYCEIVNWEYINGEFGLWTRGYLYRAQYFTDDDIIVFSKKKAIQRNKLSICLSFFLFIFLSIFPSVSEKSWTRLKRNGKKRTLSMRTVIWGTWGEYTLQKDPVNMTSSFRVVAPSIRRLQHLKPGVNVQGDYIITWPLFLRSFV